MDQRDLTQTLPDYPDHLTRKGTTLKRGGVDLTTTAFKHGERNSNLFRGLCSMRELNRPLDEALEWAHKVADDSGYDGDEAEEMAHRVWETYPPGDYPEPDETRTLAGRNFHYTDMGNADRFDHLYGDCYLYVHKWHSFMVWTGKRWERDERGLMGWLAEKTVKAIYREAADTDDSAERKIITKHANSSEAQHKIKAFIELLKNRHTATPEDFDREPMYFNCANGTFGPDGKRRYVSAKHKGECRERLRAAMGEADKGLVYKAGTTTVSQYLDAWLKDSVKDTVRQRTYERYEQIVRVHLMPGEDHCPRAPSTTSMSRCTRL